MAERKATQKQLKMIWALKKQMGLDGSIQWHGNMNFKTAQNTINRLLEIQKQDLTDAERLRNQL